MFRGLVVTTNMVIFGEDDDERERHVVRILKSAKLKAALSPGKFESPSDQECDIVKASEDMKQMDAAASIGKVAEAVVDDDK